MKFSILHLGFLSVFLSCGLVSARATQLIIVTRSGANSWAFYDAETLKINAKDKLRIGAAGKLTLLANDYNHLNGEAILRVGLLRRHANGYLVQRNGAAWVPVAPDGLKPTGSMSYADFWKGAAIAYFPDRSAKTPNTLKSEEVFAILPGADRQQAVVEFLRDETNFQGVGEVDKTAAFKERMALLVYAAKTFPPPADNLQEILLSRMGGDWRKLNNGLAHQSDLADGLDYAVYSAQAFPNEARNTKYRQELTNLNDWLNTRVAILHALAAGTQWDDFLTKYEEFDRWRNSFSDLKDLKEKAFAESSRQHREMGKQFETTNQWARALHEYRLAKRYISNDRELDNLILNAKSRDDHQAPKAAQVNMTSQPQVMISTYLSKAKSEIADHNLEEADQDIKDAAKQDATSIRVLLAQAELLRAKRSFQAARDLLDEYDRKVSNQQEIDEGIDLRTRVERESSRRIAELKAAITKAKTEGDYQVLFQSARDGVTLDPLDLDFLHDAAIGGAVTRDRADAVQYQKSYIARLAQSPGTTDPQVAAAYEELALFATAATPEPQGTAGWFSGYKAPAGVFYCPISLMPEAHIRDVKSGKQITNFIWNGNQLLQVDKSGSELGEKDIKVWFDYRKEQKGVWRISETKPDAKDERPSHFLFTSAATLPAPASPASAANPNWKYFTLLNHPDVDPMTVQRILKKQVSIIVAGNLYFNPFEWTGIYQFLAEYDSEGRVTSAQLLTPDPAEAARYKYEFTWHGPYLDKISGSEYQRSMKYEGDKLVSEIVSSHNKNSEIKYTWTNGRLTGAKSGEDAVGKSREIVFQ